MIKNKNKIALLSSAAIGTLIATALSTTAYAKTDAIITQNDNGDIIEYSYADLQEAAEAALIDGNSDLLDKFISQTTVGVHDSINGYIKFQSIKDQAEMSQLDGTEFVLDNFTEEQVTIDDKIQLPNEIKLVTVNKEDGTIKEETKSLIKEGLKVESVSAITDTTVTVKLTEVPAEVTADKFQLDINDGEVFNPAEVTVDATDATGKTFKLKLKESLANTQGVLKVNGIAKANLENTSVNFDFKKPEMVNAEVLDERHVKVTFSEEMSDAVKTIGNVEITKITDNDNVLSKVARDHVTDGFGVLSTDKKSVVYTLASDKKLVPAKYVVKAKTALLADLSVNPDNAVVKDSEIYFQANGDNLKDVTAPRITEASFDSSTKQLKLIFDEAIKNTNSAKGVTFAGVELTEPAVVGGTNKNEVTITISDDNLAKLNLKGDVKVAIKDAFQDEAENKVVGEIKATLVTPPELATADAKDSNFDETTRILTIKFNEAVKEIDVTKISIDNNGDVAQALVADDKVVEETKGTDTIKIQLSKISYDKIKDNVGKTAGLTIAQDAVKDLYETANKAIAKVEVAYIQDEKAPLVTEATFNNRTHELEIKFDESVEVKNHANIKLTHGDAETTLDTLAGANIAADVNATDTIKFKVIDGQVATVKAWFDGGKVSIITTAKGDIEDYAGNQVDIIAKGEKAPVVTLIDQIAPEVGKDEHDDIKPTKVLSKTKLQVEFNEIMDKASAEIAANYKVYDLQNDKDIVATSAVLDEDGKTVILTFGEELNVPNENNYRVIVNNVKDKAGNRIANDTKWNAFSMEEGDKTAPTVSTAKFTNKETNSIVVTFSKKVNVEEAANLANYELIKDDKAYDLTNAKIVTSTVGNNTVATITFDNVIPSLINGLTLKAKDIHDIAGNKITEADVRVEPEAAKVDAVPPTYVATLLDGSNGQNDKIKISFNKPVSAEEAAKKENYTITEPKDTEVAAQAIDGLAIESISGYDKELNQVVITLNKNNVGSLKLAVVADKILDRTGHAVANKAEELKVIDLSAPAVKEANAEAKFANKADTVSVEFDEKVYTDNAGTELTQGKVKDALVVKVGDTTLTGAGNDGWTLEGNKATLTIANKEFKKGDTVTISLKDGQKLYDKTGNVLESLNQNVKVVAESEEFKAPTSDKVKYDKAKNTVELEFAHEVDPNSVKADGSDFVVKGYTVQSATVDSSQKKVTIKIAEKLPAGDHIISLAKDSNLCDAVGNKLDADELGKVKVEADVVVPADKTAPTLQGNPTIDGTKQVVTLTFSEDILNGTANNDLLKAAVTFAADGNVFSALNESDTIEVSGRTLKVTFKSKISGTTNKIKVNAAALKDAAGNETAEITTNAIDAN
ncbi:hypothetical protein FDC62_11690 [Clostridium botulinum]|uniref:Ig-like domain-containing protein n=1 Tax=Clostridium botulinum TaxID=1491 RepID=UPI0006902967|nr:Ig-like domain-containing protein [Clostridium botulinum]NFO98839.1 hypothetical protein [Clostridium botulinum]OOV51013.1 hypothetical protein B1A66_11390 [Clostridium botulinum D/C]OOV58563.1 hypothetical protein B0673_02170 [Clostridium botulinum D/C]OOV58870.1 hypothetical protein B1A67_01950 [Clostridium botulinum D/C]OOV60477.1 hypothetical protein B1A68_01685 [Clostridium botulinum D/C]